MEQYKLIWRVYNLDAWANEENLVKLLDTLTANGEIADEMNLFIGEESKHAYFPLDEIREKSNAFKKAAAIIRERGMRVGINPWPSFGAYDDRRVDHEKRQMPFPSMVGMDGVSVERIACPVSQEFLAYVKEKFKTFAEAGPDFIWIEDDCRFTHLGGVKYPCFCPNCVAGFENGQFADREQLVEALNKPENCELRHKWSEYGAKRLATYCAAARAGVDEVDPSIDMLFMSVGSTHTTFSGDYIEQCMEAIRSKGGRPGHGFHWDAEPRKIFSKAMNVSRQVLRYTQDALCDVQYEEESAPNALLNKATESRILEAGLSIWGGCNGLAFSCLRVSKGNRPFGHMDYAVRRWNKARPFLNRYLDFARNLPQAGIWVAENKFLMAGMDVENGWFHERDDAYDLDRVMDEWPEMGIVISADQKHAYATMLQGRIINSFSDEVIEEIFQKPVFMDGEALKVLEKRGFAGYTGVRTGNTYNQCREVLTNSEINGPFAGEEYEVVDTNYELIVESDDVEVLSRGIDPYGVDIGACVTRRGNVTVFGFDPYRCIGTVGKSYQMNALFKEAGAPVIVESEDPYGITRLSAWVRTDGKRATILLINPSLDLAQNMHVVIKGEMKKATVLGVDRPEQPADAQYEDGALTVRVPDIRAWEMLLILAENDNEL